MAGSISLADLKAVLIVRTADGSRNAKDFGEAQGVRFLCPLCFTRNGGPVGTHSVICWSRAAGEDAEPKPGRWSLHGTSIDDLTLHGDPVGGARSVLLLGGCNWHGFINNGRAEEGF